jgi:hypothetical protein
MRSRPEVWGGAVRGQIEGQMASDAVGAARIIVESIADEASVSGQPDSRRGVTPTDPGANLCTASGLVFVISGPSGVGKDTIKQHLKDRKFPLGYCVTATTRLARENEIPGVHYFFVTDAEFDAMLEGGELIEHAVNHGKRYGIPYKGLRAGLRRGPDVLVTPDVQGAARNGRPRDGARRGVRLRRHQRAGSYRPDRRHRRGDRDGRAPAREATDGRVVIPSARSTSARQV